jgi:hypothetical protein
LGKGKTLLSWQDLKAIPGFSPTSELGAGGQGVAVRGLLGGIEVVVKVIFPTAFSTIAWEHAKNATRVIHPNVVPIDEFGEFTFQGQIYHFVRMPLVAGEPLSAVLSKRRFQLLDALDRCAGLADGIGAFHAASQIHRDIKPDNVLVRSSDGAFVLVDLDLVRYDDFTTLTGRLGMTPGYAAPEHAQGDNCSYRSDLFEFGVVLYEVLAGRHPFGSSSADRQDRICNGAAFDALPPIIPGDISDLIRSLLAFRVADRPRSAGVVAASLHNPAPRRRAWISDVMLGARVGQRSEDATRSNLANLDLVTVEARNLPPGFSAATWRPSGGFLLIDPTTDLFGCGEASATFVTNATDWGWLPSQPNFAQALNTPIDDPLLAQTVMGWQTALGASALITPYVRVTRWPVPGPTDLDRLEQLASASAAFARLKWPYVPILAGIVVGADSMLDTLRRDQILAVLTGLDVDGVYLVAESPRSAANKVSHLRALKDFGETLHRSNLLSIYAFGGEDLIGLLASGSWDAVITGTSLSQRARTFGSAGGGGGTPRQRLFGMALLDNVEEELLDKVASLDVGLIACGCVACGRLFAPSKPMNYQPDWAAEHYLAAQQKWVTTLRQQPVASRKSWLRSHLDSALIRAEAVDATKSNRKFKLSAGPRFASLKNELL